MEIIKHRANRTTDIQDGFGLEIDVRDYNGELVLSHDHPTKDAVKLDDFLDNIKANTLLAINMKTMEVENELYTILINHKVRNYFTFDWPVPSLIKAQNVGLICASRLSEFEREIFPNCSWVWVDAFYSIWYDQEYIISLKEKGIKVALVSPEIHNRASQLNVVKGIVKCGVVDAICTDLLEYWLDDKSPSI